MIERNKEIATEVKTCMLKVFELEEKESEKRRELEKLTKETDIHRILVKDLKNKCKGLEYYYTLDR